jgi:hypothetical protein
MTRPNNSPVIIAIIAVALGGMVILNRAQYENRPKTSAELQEEAERAVAARMQASPAAPSSPTAEQPLQEELVSLPTEVEIGDAKSPRTVVLGYSWSPEVQSDPQRANAGLKSLRTLLEQINTQATPPVHFRLVNTEVVRTQEPGVWIEGRFVRDLELSNLQTDASAIAQTIMRELSQPSSTLSASPAK